MAEGAAKGLSGAYDLVMFDLDGVVYTDGRAVPRAPQALADVRRTGSRVAFITNNASRTPVQVAAHLVELGVEAAAGDVVTSSQAAARLLRDRHGEGAPIAVLGTDGLLDALRGEQLEPVDVDVERAVAMVSGYAPEVRWRLIMRAAVRIRNGLPWVATNTDPTLPTGDGPAPGHGALVKMISEYAGVIPVVAGKPEKPLFAETVRRVGGRHPLMVGDSLHTDIRGARVAGLDSLLVMTGVTGFAELVAARADQRPTYIGNDLEALSRPGVTAAAAEDGWRARDWQARLQGDRIAVVGSGDADAWWAVVAAAAWHHLDETGAPVSGQALRPPEPGRGRGSLRA